MIKLFTPRVPLKERLFFTEHLAVMLKSTIALDRALNSLQQQAESRNFRAIIKSILESVRRGDSFAIGLQPFTGVFGNFYVSMIKAGESSGKLDETLRRLYFQMKKDYDLRSKVLSALAYPAFILIAMIGIGAAMMFFVIPKLIPLFAGLNAELPLSTRILIGAASFLSQYALLVIPGFLVLIIATIVLLRGPLKPTWHTLLLRLPGLSGIIIHLNLARFARTFSTLLATDILVVDALTTVSQVVGNLHYRHAILNAAQAVQKGLPITQSLKLYPRLFPATMETMIAVGEESGNLSELLQEVAEFYEERVDDATKGIASIIEPLLIVLLGVAVGGIALAILMPMYALMEKI